MKHNKHNTEKIIHQDLNNLQSGIRLFHATQDSQINDITKSIIKHSPTSILLKLQAFKEYGKTAILLEAERQLASLSTEITPTLTKWLKVHVNQSGTEILGNIPSATEYLSYFINTLHDFCAQTGKDQKTVLCLEFNSKSFADEFINYLTPPNNNLPNKLFIFATTDNTNLSNNTLHYKSELNYYWKNPSHLGSDLNFLSRKHPSSLIEHFTNNEISLLLRLWGLSDIAILFGEKSTQFLSQYSNQDLVVLLDNEEFIFTINNTDRFEAEYKIYRELAFHYAIVNDLKKANYCKDKALSAISKSNVSNITRTKCAGLIWADRAQVEKNKLKLSDAIKSLKTQKSFYESHKDQLADELSIISFNLGTCYRANGEYKKALVELNRSLELEKKSIKNNVNLSTILEIGRVHVDLGDFKSALAYFEKVDNSIPENAKTGLLYTKGIALAYIIYLNKEIGSTETLFPLAEKAIRFFSAVGAIEDIKKLQVIINY